MPEGLGQSTRRMVQQMAQHRKRYMVRNKERSGKASVLKKSKAPEVAASGGFAYMRGERNTKPRNIIIHNMKGFVNYERNN